MNCSKKPKDKRIVVLGSTGSVGRQTLDVAARTGAEVIALSASSNIGLLEDQIRQFHPHLCAVRDSEAAKQLRIAVSDTDTVVIDGENAASEVASLPEAEMVFNSTSGFAGLFPTLAAIAAGHDVALANKETLVAAGEIVMNSARERRVRILPVDSEHCAVFQCLQTRAAEEPRAALGDPYGLRRTVPRLYPRDAQPSYPRAGAAPSHMEDGPENHR